MLVDVLLERDDGEVLLKEEMLESEVRQFTVDYCRNEVSQMRTEYPRDLRERLYSNSTNDAFVAAVDQFIAWGYGFTVRYA